MGTERPAILSNSQGTKDTVRMRGRKAAADAADVRSIQIIQVSATARCENSYEANFSPYGSSNREEEAV